MDLNQKHSIGWEEAVSDRYHNLYLPTVLEIGKNGGLKNFLGRTEADLYLWISDQRQKRPIGRLLD